MNRTYQKSHANVTTPWGRSSSGTTFAQGIVFYHTASQGGFKVVKKLNQQIPAAFRRFNGWYEEDCDGCIPFYFFHETIYTYCCDHGLEGWGKSAEEYFAEFSKNYFRKQLEHYFPVASYLTFDTQYSEAYIQEKWGAYSVFNEAVADVKRHMALLAQPRPQKGDTVQFAQPIEFSDCQEDTFVFMHHNFFEAPGGWIARIKNWQMKEYRLQPAIKEMTLF